MRGRHGIALRLGIPVLLGSALIFVLIFALTMGVTALHLHVKRRIHPARGRALGA